MQNRVLGTLRAIGADLDRDQLPRVYNGGLVLPSGASVPLSTLGKDKYNGSSGKRRPAAGSWERTAGGTWSTNRPWSPGAPSPLVSASLRETYQADVDAVMQAYPGSTVWSEPRGMWLLVESKVLTGLAKTATFLLNIPYRPALPVKAWGFWATPVGYCWIGPRHTNFPDGSICAFEPRDGTWLPGGSIVTLLDLYTLWALRHLHLEVFGRWPGRQLVVHPFERLTELYDDEACGCDVANTTYAECCKASDLEQDRASIFADFYAKFLGGHRQVPTEVLRFMYDQRELPSLTTIHPGWEHARTVLKRRHQARWLRV